MFSAISNLFREWSIEDRGSRSSILDLRSSSSLFVQPTLYLPSVFRRDQRRFLIAALETRRTAGGKAAAPGRAHQAGRFTGDELELLILAQPRHASHQFLGIGMEWLPEKSPSVA